MNKLNIFLSFVSRDHLGNARINFRANGTGVTHLEDMHYYPFGMLMEGMGTNSPANNYAYNGKELNENFALNLSDYGARWYDAALGKWWSVDAIGTKYSFWSPYNYAVDNPIIYIDPDGMDIVLGITQRQGETSEKFQERRYAYFDQVQSLTNDKLAFDGNKIVIAKAGDGNKDAGTQLIRNLIDGVQTEDGTTKNFTVTIVAGTSNGTEPVDEKGNRTTDSENKSQDGTGTGSKVTFDINGSGLSVVNADGTTGRPAKIGLAHELIHADHNMRGQNTNNQTTTSVDPDGGGGVRTLTREELNTRQQENVIRREQMVKPRSVNPGQ